MARISADLKYTAEHEWVDDSVSPVRVGVTSVATEALGDVVYVDPPDVGSSLTAGDVCGEIESTKSVSELFAPVTGTVVEVNQAAVDDPALINSDPYGDGWLFTVDVAGPSTLMTAEDYARANDAELA
ncbi:glycine cleavage system protein GcvH [Georgenia sp. MJ173]|uniref:glycine cleavage system protein GcvH n=1 Tax=Georgenia sunbinii TaxID=3117728 RepID=UPI002F26C4F4